MECTEDDTFWCPSLKSCIPTCSEFCDCVVETTPGGGPTTTEAPNNNMTTNAVTTTDTTPHFDNYCDRVCFGLEAGFSGDCCEATYCDCEDYGNFPVDCVEEGTLWCPEQAGCISGCEADCGCQMASTQPGPTVTGGSQDPTTTPDLGEYCDQICYGAEDGDHGDCCHPSYCNCASYGNFEMECHGEGNLWCEAQADCIPNCLEDCGCSM